MTVDNPDASVLFFVFPHLHSFPLSSLPLRLLQKDILCCVASQELVREKFCHLKNVFTMPWQICQHPSGTLPEMWYIQNTLSFPRFSLPHPLYFRILICLGRITESENFGLGSDLGGILNPVIPNLFLFMENYFSHRNFLVTLCKETV